VPLSGVEPDVVRGCLLVVAFVAVACGCGGKPAARPASASATASALRATSSCPATAPGGNVPAGFDYGSDSLAVALWPRGKLIAGRLADGSSYAEIEPDGSIRAKLGWWRGVPGRLTIDGERLDAAARPLRADVPDGYGATGFQATQLQFPSTGCWRVRGRVGRSSLTFVVLGPQARLDSRCHRRGRRDRRPSTAAG
jgi:hypothetical protein